MAIDSQHIWIVAPYIRDQEEIWKQYVQNTDTSYCINCHRNIGGVYTGTGALLRRIVPVIYAQYPNLVKEHSLEILSIAPDLSSIVPPPRGTLTSLAIPKERTRFYARTRTQRLTHGIIELLIKYINITGIKDLAIFFINTDTTDMLDQEFIAALLRRTRTLPFRVIVGTASEQPPERILLAVKKYACKITASPLAREERTAWLQNQTISSDWQTWLLQHTEGWRGEWEPLLHTTALFALSAPEDQSFRQGLQKRVGQLSQAEKEQLAQAYVETDCTSDNPLAQLAYELIDHHSRQQLHDRRAERLTTYNQKWYSLGAIPFHYEHGKDPANAGARALGEALNYCFEMGYYEITLDLAVRGRKIVDRDTQQNQYWNFTTKMITVLAVLERFEESEKYCKETRAWTSTASIQLQLAYATAMLYTRYYVDHRRDHLLAKEWIQVAIALTRSFQGVSPEERAFAMVFNMNALALIELHLGHPEEALKLLAEGLAAMDSDLGPDTYQLHRTVLLYNRAQVYARLKQYELALEAFTEVIRLDPYYSEYYFDRANIYQRLERYEEALSDYNQAISYSPPYPEAYYNRALVLAQMQREDEALADYTYALELEPSSDQALINRVAILYEQGRYVEARQSITEGMAYHPANPQLQCMLGLIEMGEEHTEEAYQCFTMALEKAPSLREAWSNRAVLEFERGNVDAAIHDLSHALKLAIDATVLYNRGFAYQAQQRWQEAIADYTQALEMQDADRQELFSQRGFCYLQNQQKEQAQQDFKKVLSR